MPYAASLMRLLRDARVRSLMLFAALAVAHTWPLASAPAYLSRNDNADTVLNEWTIAWVAHQMPRDPIHLFDANIFYPDRDTLAYSEHLLVPSLMGAPLLWLGASPVLTYNLLLLAGLTLTGWSMSLLIWHWTGDWAAGLVSGVLAAFNAHTLTRLPHVQAQHTEFLPFALLAFNSLLAEPRLRTAVLLAVWFALQGLSSFYLLVFAAVALAVGGLVRPEDWWGARGRRLVPFLAVAALLAAVLVVPFLLPYKRLGIVRSLDEVAHYAATRAESALPLYSRLRSVSDAVVVEFPFFPPDRIFFNAPYLLNATRHWRPMLNGYSGIVPASYQAHYRDLRGFPDDHAITALRAAGVTHVVIHEVDLRARSGDGAMDALGRSRDLQMIERDGIVSLYRLIPGRVP